MATHALEALQAEVAALKHAGQREADGLECSIEEAEQHITDVRRDTFEFKRDIIIGAENPLNGTTASDRVVKFLEARARALFLVCCF